MQLLNEADAVHEPTLLTLDQTTRAFGDSQNEISRQEVIYRQEASNPRVLAQASGKIILSGNNLNSFVKRALAVPVDIHITAMWNNRNNSHEIEPRSGDHSGKRNCHNKIPVGKCMGSSTALVVARARCFLGNNCKDEALDIEAEINRGHSGIDFAPIWERRPIIITGGTYE